MAHELLVTYIHLSPYFRILSGKPWSSQYPSHQRSGRHRFQRGKGKAVEPKAERFEPGSELLSYPVISISNESHGDHTTSNAAGSERIGPAKGCCPMNACSFLIPLLVLVNHYLQQFAQKKSGNRASRIPTHRCIGSKVAR